MSRGFVSRRLEFQNPEQACETLDSWVEKVLSEIVRLLCA